MWKKQPTSLTSFLSSCYLDACALVNFVKWRDLARFKHQISTVPRVELWKPIHFRAQNRNRLNSFFWALIWISILKDSDNYVTWSIVSKSAQVSPNLEDPTSPIWSRPGAFKILGFRCRLKLLFFSAQTAFKRRWALEVPVRCVLVIQNEGDDDDEDEIGTMKVRRWRLWWRCCLCHDFFLIYLPPFARCWKFIAPMEETLSKIFSKSWSFVTLLFSLWA